LTVSPAPGAKLAHAPWKAKQDAAAGENRESHSELSEDSVADSRSIVLALAGTAASDASNDSAAGASEHAAIVMADAESAGGAAANASSSFQPAQPAAAGGVSTGTALLLGIPLLALAGGGGGGGGGVLTWWDSLNATADILTLQFAPGATTLQLAADNHSFKVI